VVPYRGGRAYRDDAATQLNRMRPDLIIANAGVASAVSARNSLSGGCVG